MAEYKAARCPVCGGFMAGEGAYHNYGIRCMDCGNFEPRPHCGVDAVIGGSVYTFSSRPSRFGGSRAIVGALLDAQGRGEPVIGTCPECGAQYRIVASNVSHGGGACDIVPTKITV